MNTVLALHKHISAVLIVSTNAKECEILRQCKKLMFYSRLPLRRYIAQLATFEVDPGIILSLSANEDYLHTILATGVVSE